MSYATPADLEAAATFYGVTPPPAAQRARLLELASADVDRHLGASYAGLVVLAEQADALRDATAVQALYRAAQGGDLALGLDDGLASVGPLSFSLRTPARFSPEATDLLAGVGLYARSGTVVAPVDAVP